MTGLLPWVEEESGHLEVRYKNVRSVSSQVRKDEKLLILPIVGKFRQAKTYCMNVLLSALNKNGTAHFDPGDTIGGAENFSFQNGDEGHTTGIMAYSKVLHVVTAKNEKLALILLDTQGTAEAGRNEKIKDSILIITSLIFYITISHLPRCFDKDSLRALTLMVEHSQKIWEQANLRLMVLIPDSDMDKCCFGPELENLEEWLKNSPGKTVFIDRSNEAFHTLAEHQLRPPQETEERLKQAQAEANAVSTLERVMTIAASIALALARR